MDKPKTPQLTIDREFRDLIRPLMKDEYRYLESTLMSEGCQETPESGTLTTGKKPSFGYAPDNWGAETFQTKHAVISLENGMKLKK